MSVGFKPFSLRDVQFEISGSTTGSYGVLRAIADSGESFDSLADFENYEFNPIVLDTPTFTTANNTEFTDAVSISWNSVTNADSYEYNLYTGLNGGGTDLGAFSNSSTTYSETWVNLSNSVGADGSIAVVALKSPSNYSSYSTNLNFYLILEKPVITSPANGHTFISNASTCTFTWNAVPNAQQYAHVLDSSTTTSPTITFSGFELQELVGVTNTGSFAVYARRNVGSDGHISELSDYLTFYVQDPMGTPTISSPTENENWGLGTDVTFSWNTINDATDYDWELRVESGAPIDSGTTTSTSVIYDEIVIYNDTGGGSENAQFRVRARNVWQTGNWSSWRTFAVQ
jgi:hypothetical protein